MKIRFKPVVASRGVAAAFVVSGVAAFMAATTVTPAFAQEEGDDLAAIVGPGEAEASISREQAAELARSGDEAAFEQLVDYFASVGGDADGVAAAAADLIKEFGGDPDLLIEASGRVADAASEAMSASRVERFAGGDDLLEVSADGFAFDFTTSDSDTLPGFERVTPNDPRLEGTQLSGLRRPASAAVVSAGVTGVSKFKTKLPNGRNRIVIMTDDLGDWSQFPRPLGNRVIVNGDMRRVLTKDPGDWLGGISVESVEQGVGGAIVLEIEITGDELELEFPGGDNIYLAGLIVEPIEEFTEDLDRFDAEEQIAVAVAESLAEIVTEAGEPEPVVEDEFEGSPS